MERIFACDSNGVVIVTTARRGVKPNSAYSRAARWWSWEERGALRALYRLHCRHHEGEPSAQFFARAAEALHRSPESVRAKLHDLRRRGWL